MRMGNKELERSALLKVLGFVFVVFFASPCTAQEASGISLTHVPLSAADGKMEFRVSLVSKARCMMGDLDAIALDMERGKGTTRGLKFTLESLGGSDPEVLFAKRQGKDTNDDNVLGNYFFSVMPKDKPRVMGLFLCLGSKENSEKPCSAERAMDFSEITLPYQIDAKEAIGKDKKPKPAHFAVKGEKPLLDKIYFFRFVIIDKDKAVFPTAAMDEKNYKAMADYLKSSQAEVPDYDVLASKLKEYGRTLGSMPLRSAQGRAEVILPYYSAKKCGH